MKKNVNTYKDFGKEVENFFNSYLVSELGVSQHTIRSYRDALVALLEFYESIKGVTPDRLSFEYFTKENIVHFLDWLESKGVSVTTRNNRCAAIKSFAKYLIYSDPTHMSQWQLISSIRAKKAVKEMFSYLTIDGMTKLLESIDVSTCKGRRDHTLLSILYYTGARAQELADLTPSSIRLSKPYIIEIFGKGRKKRCVPIDDDVFNLVKNYMTENGLDKAEKNEHPLFFNVWGGKLSTAGIQYIIDKYFNPARIANPELFPNKISPHSFRHSRAMHLLESGVNIVFIRDILGHVSIQTTEVYARANSKQKREAIIKAYNGVGKVEPKQNSWDDNPKLKAFLKGLV